ncbi:hypothetical protein BB561_005382 [Smittium simulii]|uniref:CMP/dCMP-type deaminase domain-containing protein n=1 Tax=Smittium simulii TaxID=133385 RepID=A0A2T9YAM3_9FUNG|nr:hypothetical protein BB561_005382 [Smittium simulii]
MTNSDKELQQQKFMRMAIEQAQKCISVGGAYNVGAVIVRNHDQKVISMGYSRELPGNTHAEECALQKLMKETEQVYNVDLSDCSMYTTMEPCSTRLSGKLGCVHRLIDSGIPILYYSVAEPPNFVKCTGLQIAKDAGISVIHVSSPGIEAATASLNAHISA